MTSTRSHRQCWGSVPPSFPVSDLRSCRLSASKHKGLQILETWPLAREWSTKDSFRYLTLQMNFITNDKSFISNTKPIYLRVGQCQIGNGERTWSVCQSTFKGKVTLGQKGRVGVPPWKDEENLLEGRHNAQHFTYRQGKTPRQDFR